MDEPFASVDAQTREDLEDLARGLPEKFHVSVVLVTHDIDEAVYLSDRLSSSQESRRRCSTTSPSTLGTLATRSRRSCSSSSDKRALECTTGFRGEAWTATYA